MSQDTVPESVQNRTSFVKRVKGWVSGRMNREIGREIQTILEERHENDHFLSDDERELIVSALRFGNRTAEDVCVPRGDIVYLSVDETLSEVLEKFKASDFSRMPVCGENLDEVLGFVTIKDVVKRLGKNEDDFDLSKVMRPCTFVPETLAIPAVLSEMRANRVQMVVMVDEYGGTAGLITLKDLLEELVGDIEDENEQHVPIMLVRLASGRVRIDPRLPVNELESDMKDLLGTDDEGDYDTVGGFALSLAGRVPEKGEKIELPTGHTLLVSDADPRRVLKLTFVPSSLEERKAC